MAETWSVLTRLPLKPKLLPREALEAVERLWEKGFTIVELQSDTYKAALRRCADVQASSGAIFDALHLVVAETIGAELLLTFNVGDFQRLANEQSPDIVAPPDPPSLEIGAS